MTKMQYAVISAGLIFEAIRQGFLGISDEKGSRGRAVYLRGLFAMNGPLVRYDGDKIDHAMDLIQMAARKDFNTVEKIKNLVLAGLSGASVQVALYPFLPNDLAIDIVVHHARFLEMKGALDGESAVTLFRKAIAFVSENLGINERFAGQYCGFIFEQMLSYQETIPPRSQGGVAPPRFPA
ncbi:MAG: hypothetical protein AAB513_00550 [Patescibacteria group bacterium]